jgi:cathepsin B
MTLLATCLLAAIACVFADEKFYSQSLVNRVNSMHTTWQAGINNKFEGMPKSTVRRMMGVLMDEEQRLRKTLPEHTNNHIYNADIPDTFDARTEWPKCADVIGNIRDQSACGSCWAVAAAGAMSDRICIASDGQAKPTISAADLMECCWNCGYGCEGGYPSSAWSYFHSTGLVTGGSYSSKAGCKPYPFAECEHHNNATTYKPCPSKLYSTPKCTRECQKGYTTAYNDDKSHAKSSYRVSSDVAAIQKEIMSYGSIEAAFTVYEDFLSYKSGVYQHTTGSYDGGHAVRMIGWGTEDGTPYWLIANSWNSDWGDKGYFKILRGKDECGIESGLVAGHIN